MQHQPVHRKQHLLSNRKQQLFSHLKQHLLSALQQNLPKEEEKQHLMAVVVFEVIEVFARIVVFAVIAACKTVTLRAPMGEREKEEEIPQTDPIFAALAGMRLRQVTTLARLYCLYWLYCLTTLASLYSSQSLCLKAGEKAKQVEVSGKQDGVSKL
jgi:hypothetical protein